VELLDLGELVNKPVRNLSLGERMKMEFVAALLHKPIVLFLDEPTLGLDVTMQKRIRTFVAEYNRRFGATVLLTSHYMADVQALCKRVVVIHHGRLLFDGNLSDLATRFNATKTIGVMLRDGTVDAPADLSAYGEVIETDDGRLLLRVPRAEAPDVATRLLRDLPVADLTIEDPPIDDVIESVFATAKPTEPAEPAEPAAASS
jgi:viologen exporter family transport system ATP-binding protein